MSDQTYTVRTVYTVESKGAQSSIDRLGSLLGRIGGVLDRLKSMLLGLAGIFAAAFIGGAVAAGVLLHRLTEVGGQAETTRLALAGMINAQMFSSSATPLGNFPEALGASDALIQRMRDHARALPGTFADLQAVMQGSLSGGIQAGQSLAAIEGQAARFMAVTKSLGIDAEQAGRDMTLMMEGRAGAQVASFARLRPLIGKTAQEFNQLTPLQRWQAIGRALQGFTPMVDAYEHSWDAVSSTTEDHLASLFRVGTTPLFEAARTALASLNGWIERNQTQLEAMARLVGGVLTRAFQELVAQVRRLDPLLQRMAAGPFFRTLRDRMEGFARGEALPTEGMGARVSNAASGAFSAVSQYVPSVAMLVAFAEELGRSEQNLAALRQAGEGLLSALLSLDQAVVGITMALGSLVGVFHAGAMPGLAALVGDIGAVVTGIANVLGPWIASVVAILSPLFGWLGRFIGAVGSIVGSILRLIAVLTLLPFRNMLPGLNFFRERIASASAVLSRIGDQLMGPIEMVASALRRLVSWIEHLPGMNGMLSGEGPGTPTPLRVNLTPDPVAQGDGWGGLPREGGFDPAGAQRFARLFRRPNATPSSNVNVTNHVTVHQTIEQAEDPDRVLIATREGVLDALLHPIESTGALITR